MAAPLSPEGQMLLKLLSDGSWHMMEEVHQRLGQAVAPGKALRRYESSERTRVRRYGPRKGPELSEDQKIASGQRAIVNDSVNSLRRRYIEVDEAGGQRRIRRRIEPLPVVDGQPAMIPPVHVPAQSEPQFAAGEDRRSCDFVGEEVDDAFGFFSADEMRALVADEVAVALDLFQRRMQSWLGVRFAEVERALQTAGSVVPFAIYGVSDRGVSPARVNDSRAGKTGE